MKRFKRPLTFLALAAPLLLAAGLVASLMQSEADTVSAGITDGYIASVDDLPAGASFASDSFGGTDLESMWTPIDVGPDDSITVGQGTVRLVSNSPVPTGAWGTLNRPRIAQQVEDEDFAVDVRFLDIPDTPGQSVGLTFESDTRNWIGFEASFDPVASQDQLRLSALRTSDGETALRLVGVSPVTEDSIVLRVIRRGANWAFEYSTDGTLFTPLGAFDEALEVAQVAIGVGAKAPDDERPVPEASFRVNSFTNAAGDSTGPQVEVNVIGPGTFVISPPLSQLQLGDTIAIEATPGQDAAFESWGGDGTADGAVFRTEVNGDTEVTLTFEDLKPLPVIDVWYGDDQTFGSDGVPQTWVNILGNVADRDGIAEFTYSLNGGARQQLTVGPDGRRLAVLGDFNAEIAFVDLELGDNTVVLRAVDNLGNEITETINVTRVDGDGTLRDRTYTWDGVDNPQDVVQIPDGKWAINDNDQIYTVDPDYDRVFAIGDESWMNYEVEVEVTPNALDVNAYQENSGSPSIYLVGSWPGHVDWTGLQPRTGYWPLGAFALWVWPPEKQLQLTGNEREAEATTPRQPPEFGTTYIFKLRAVEIPDGIAYSFKVWARGDSEPEEWELTIVDESGPRSGSILIAAHHIDASFGTITVDAL